MEDDHPRFACTEHFEITALRLVSHADANADIRSRDSVKQDGSSNDGP
jgi:hypothetical protein